MIGTVNVRIIPRRTADGMAFTEILYRFEEDGEERHALTRLAYAVTDSPHARAAQEQAFRQRQARRAA